RASEGDKGNDLPQQPWQAKQQPQRQSTPDSASSLQNIPLGSKRKEIKSVKGVLNIAMGAPLNGSSRSRPSSTPGSPLPEARGHLLSQQQQQPPTSFGTGESSQLNGYNASAAAAARAAKVKSDLLMGLNSPSIRSDRPPSTPTKASSDMDLPPGTPLKLNGFYGSPGYDITQMGANVYGGGGQPSSMVSGPPPGLGMPSSGSVSNSSNSSPRMMSTLVNRHLENGQNGMSFLSNTNNTNNNNNNNINNKPMDVNSMMNSLDFFGPGQPNNALMMNSNWSSLANGNGHHHGDHPTAATLMNGTAGNFSDLHEHAQGHHGSPNNPTDKSGNGGINGVIHSGTATDSSTARSVEDLETQVINAKMETQMLENQLNAVIKRNRRKLYA
ncbi:hypothetical protein BGX34_005829, partial [Mortierella sp. NVP85]